MSANSEPVTVHLIDASPYIFRSYFALPSSMTAPDGLTVNAAYGFANFLLKYIADEEPTHIAIAFDESLTTSFRNDIYPEYKAQRELPPPELVAQLAACQELARAFGCRTFADDRYEADDLIGTLELGLRKAGRNCLVVSSDKDLAQLVSATTTFFDYARDERYGPDEVVERFGVRPDQIADYLGLAGDSVDNIPGVAGIGPKTAIALLGAFDSLDGIYAQIDEVPTLSIRGAKSVAKKLADARETALLSRELATISIEAPARAGIRELKLSGADPELVDPLFERLGFSGLRNRIVRWK